MRTVFYLYDDIYESVFDRDDFSDRFVLNMRLDGRQFFGQGFQFLLVGAFGDDEFASQFAIDLDDDFDLVFHQHSFIESRPRFVGDCFLGTEDFPEFLAHMRGEGAEEFNEALRMFDIDRFGFEAVVDEDHHLRNGRVEIEGLHVVGNLLYGEMIGLVEAMVVLAA
jgi:hypothetical protein